MQATVSPVVAASPSSKLWEHFRAVRDEARVVLRTPLPRGATTRSESSRKQLRRLAQVMIELARSAAGVDPELESTAKTKAIVLLFEAGFGVLACTRAASILHAAAGADRVQLRALSVHAAFERFDLEVRRRASTDLLRLRGEEFELLAGELSRLDARHVLSIHWAAAAASAMAFVNRREGKHSESRDLEAQAERAWGSAPMWLYGDLKVAMGADRADDIARFLQLSIMEIRSTRWMRSNKRMLEHARQRGLTMGVDVEHDKRNWFSELGSVLTSFVAAVCEDRRFLAALVGLLTILATQWTQSLLARGRSSSPPLSPPAIRTTPPSGIEPASGRHPGNGEPRTAPTESSPEHPGSPSSKPSKAPPMLMAGHTGGVRACVTLPHLLGLGTPLAASNFAEPIAPLHTGGV